MLDKETYFKELARYFDSIRNDECKSEVPPNTTDCTGVSCENCMFNDKYYMCPPQRIFETFEALEKWSKEHPKPKHKISQLEYDILCTALDYEFVGFDCYWLGALLEKGYFKGATLNTDIVDYFNHCEVVDNKK